MTTTPTHHPPTSTVEWARQHGEHFRGWLALDNYEPCPRETATVDVYRYSTATVTDGLIIDGAMALRDATRAVYLIDDGLTVRPYYVAAYHPDGSHVIAHPFPVNVDADGSPILRADDGRPVDFASWSLGPRRAYHVKLTGGAR